MSQREKIFVTYTPVFHVDNTGIPGAYHMALHYVDRNGVHHVIEAHPKVGRSSASSRGLFAKENADSGFGAVDPREYNNIITTNEVNEIERVSRLFRRFKGAPNETLLEGDDLSERWNTIRRYKDFVARHGFEYRGPWSNSNSFAGWAIKSAILPAPKLTVWYNVPGYGDSLGAPLDPDGLGRYDPYLKRPQLARSQPTPLHAARTVAKNDAAIRQAAAEFGLNADFLRAVIFTENAYRTHIPAHADLKPQWPVRLNPHVAREVPGADPNKPRDNIRIAAKVLAHAARRFGDQTPESVYRHFDIYGREWPHRAEDLRHMTGFLTQAWRDRAWGHRDWKYNSGAAPMRIPEFPPVLNPKSLPGSAPALPSGTFDKTTGEAVHGPGGQRARTATGSRKRMAIDGPFPKDSGGSALPSALPVSLAGRRMPTPSAEASRQEASMARSFGGLASGPLQASSNRGPSPVYGGRAAGRPNADRSVKERIDEIERMIAVRGPGYWNSNAIQAEYRDLLTVQEKDKRRRPRTTATSMGRF